MFCISTISAEYEDMHDILEFQPLAGLWEHCSLLHESSIPMERECPEECRTFPTLPTTQFHKTNHFSLRFEPNLLKGLPYNYKLPPPSGSHKNLKKSSTSSTY